MPERLKEDESHWIAVSDLLSGLMAFFILISIGLLILLLDQPESGNGRQVQVACQNIRNELGPKIQAVAEKHFGGGAGIRMSEAHTGFDIVGTDFTFGPLQRDPSLRHDTAFKNATPESRTEFHDLVVPLRSFCPAFFSMLEKFQDNVLAIQVLGHASSDWSGLEAAANRTYGRYNTVEERQYFSEVVKKGTDEKKSVAYMMNLPLSVSRAANVAHLCMTLQTTHRDHAWVIDRIVVDGRSSADVVLDDDAKEDPVRSRRVGFNVVLNAEGVVCAESIDGAVPDKRLLARLSAAEPVQP